MDVSTDVVVVVPTIRKASITAFLAAWHWPCQVIIVEDNPEKTFDLRGVDHYAWPDIERDLGADSWIIPRRTDCIRSYGVWEAWQTGKPYILTLDDDCLPAKRGPEREHWIEFAADQQSAVAFIAQHLNNLQPHAIERWHSTLAGDYPRGYPYEQTRSMAEVGISHGLWTGNLDYDSITQLRYSRSESPLTLPREGIVPRGQYFPMCGMNLAWRREYTPLLYFLLMGQDHQGDAYPFDRFGDIWAGVIAKKVFDHLGVAAWSGGPFVEHTRASSVWANFDKEHAGIKANETFWQIVDSTPLTSDSTYVCYRHIADVLARQQGSYWRKLREAMYIWSALYE